MIEVYRFYLSFLLLAPLCSSPGCDRCDGADEPRPAAAERGLADGGRLQVSEGDRCPVCAMEVEPEGRFSSAIVLRDGRTFYFCGTGCMIRSWLHPEVFLGVEREELRRAVVREYFEGRPVDALGVTFVAGSDVVGLMGPALVPLSSEADVATFRQRHGGEATFGLAELDDERWRQITGRPAVSEER